MLASTALNLSSFAAVSVKDFPAHNSRKLSSQFGFRSLPLLALPHALLKRSRTCVKTAVAAVESSFDTAVKKETERKKYYFVVANAKFMLDEEEHFQEQLFERLRYYGECGKEQDFWLVIEPKFLDQFPVITKRLKRPAVALVSTNGPWIKFMKLRLDRVLQDCFEADSVEEALASSPVKLEFEKPENWTAPYPKYKSGWWDPFLLPESQTQKV
ncbi:unnamed protein product [Cuscuta epithymum]|uniref:Ycf54 n=1 Tax=Cuscuta epithymum TaxID=186058 RepID=A0AAV0CCV8_9ASTE|nr:unnamed protein product [Cuscuta epithymum]